MSANLMNKEFSYKIFYMLICLTCMNFMESGAAVFLLCSLFSVFFLRMYVKINIVSLFIFLLFCGVFLSSYFFDSGEGTIKSFNFLFPYFLGFSGCLASVNKEDYVKKCLFAIFLGFGFLLFYIYYCNYNNNFIGTRFLINPWTHQLMPATLAGLVASVVIGYSFFGIFLSKKLFIKIMSCFLVAIAIVQNLNSATRTPIILFFVVYCLGTCSYLIGAEDGKRKNQKYYIVILMFLLFFALYDFVIKDMVYLSPLYERFSDKGLETSRVDIMYEHFKYMFNYLWGGGFISISTKHLPHNFIQEGHDLYGLIAFISLLFFFVRGVVKCAALFLKKNKNNTDNLVFCFYLSVLIQLCMEPVFRGYPQLFWMFLLIDGVYDAYYVNQNEVCISKDKSTLS